MAPSAETPPELEAPLSSEKEPPLKRQKLTGIYIPLSPPSLSIFLIRTSHRYTMRLTIAEDACDTYVQAAASSDHAMAKSSISLPCL